jgi:hypothetical protein
MYQFYIKEKRLALDGNVPESAVRANLDILKERGYITNADIPPLGQVIDLSYLNEARRDLGSRSTLVMCGTRLVVTIGLQDTIVVDTPDALLVCAADRSQDVRAIAEELARAREEDA